MTGADAGLVVKFLLLAGNVTVLVQGRVPGGVWTWPRPFAYTILAVEVPAIGCSTALCRISGPALDRWRRRSRTTSGPAFRRGRSG